MLNQGCQLVIKEISSVIFQSKYLLNLLKHKESLKYKKNDGVK